MAKKSNAPLCARCETPFRTASPFCAVCGAPTQWASHDERVAWEVRQWRASRETAEHDAPQMMLVRTQAGFEPMPVARVNDYVWDQPLHPERQTEPEPLAPASAQAAPASPPATLVPRPEEARQPNGTGSPHRNGAEPAPRLRPRVEAAQDLAAQPAPAQPEAPGRDAVAAPSPAPSPSPAPTMVAADDERVSVSIKAVALGIALVVGLPFGSHMLNADNDPAAPARSAAAPVAAKPAGLVAAHSGFEQLSPDAIRYAVVVVNPNKSYVASGVTVSIAVHDAAGRLVGTDSERVAAVPAAGATGIAGAVGVSGPAARMTVRVGTSLFREGATPNPFRVRAVRLSRSGKQVVVSAAVSGVVAAKGARVVAVYLDRSGKVVGGDFTYADVPQGPRSTPVVISTAGIRGTVVRVQIYVMPR